MLKEAIKMPGEVNSSTILKSIMTEEFITFSWKECGCKTWQWGWRCLTWDWNLVRETESLKLAICSFSPWTLRSALLALPISSLLTKSSSPSNLSVILMSCHLPWSFNTAAFYWDFLLCSLPRVLVWNCKNAWLGYCSSLLHDSVT